MNTALTRAAAQGYQEQAVQFLQALIAIPSTSTQERLVAERIAAEMRACGLEDVHFDPIGNVLGRVGHGPVTILYDAHIDTVGVGDEAAWAHDPFMGRVEHGVVYGRGASDNKAAMATMLYGARILKGLNFDEDRFTLWVMGVVQEEDCDGWAVGEAIRLGAVQPDFAVLGEATSLDVYRGHRGRCEIKVTTKGVSCHASAPDRGENALYKMARVLRGIESLNGQLKDDPFLGKGTIAATKLETKTPSLNAVPDEAVLYIDRRMTAGETAETAIAEVQAIAGDATVELLRYEAKSWRDYLAATPKDFPTWVLPEQHPLVEAGLTTAEGVLARRPAIGRWVFSTDGVSIMGKLGIPTIGFGPGEEKWAHTVQDQVPIDHLVKAMAFYAAFPLVLTDRLEGK